MGLVKKVAYKNLNNSLFEKMVNRQHIIEHV